MPQVTTKRRQSKPLAHPKALRTSKLPKARPPVLATVNRLAKQSRERAKAKRAWRWFNVYVTDKKPIGIVWFGDPHLGDATEWDALLRDVKTCASTPGLFAANIGDASNNWGYSLVRKYADEEASRKTERELIRWFLADAGLTWLVWLMGNHDSWEHGDEIIRAMDIHGKVPMPDWEARFKLVWPGGATMKVHAAHDFPGSSMHNPTHGNARAVRWLQGGADLYVCGHRHTFGTQQFQVPETGQCPVMVRAAGYKVDDEYARRKGFPEATAGRSVMTIFDPTAGPAGRVLAFADVQQGAAVLKAMRGAKCSKK